MLPQAIPTLRAVLIEVCDSIVLVLSALNTAFEGALLEAIIVVGSCLLFLVISWLNTGKKKSKSGRCGRCDRRMLCLQHPIGGCTKVSSMQFDANKNLSPSKSSTSKLKQVECQPTGNTMNPEVRKLEASVARSGRNPKQALESLSIYGNLVWQQQAQLSLHFSEHRRIHCFYLSLVSCAMQVDFQAQPSILGSTPDAVDGVAGWTQRLLSDMRGFEFARTVEFYAAMMKMLGNNNCFKEVLSLHAEMLTDGIEPNSVALIWLLNAAVAIDDTCSALRYFRSLAHLEPPSQRTYMTVLRVYGRRKDWEGALKLVEEMESLGSRPDNLVLNHVLGLCVSAGQVIAAETLLGQWDDIVDVISCNTLLKGYTQVADLTKSEALLQRMVSKGPSPNLITFNTIMDCTFRALKSLDMLGRQPAGCRRSDIVDFDSDIRRSLCVVAKRPWELLEQLTDFGLEPDRYTCSTIVKGMHLAGGSAVEIDRAVALIKHLGPTGLQASGVIGCSRSRGDNTRLSEVLFNTLLDICGSCQDLDRMVEIFVLMKTFSVSFSAVTFNTLIKAFGQAGRIHRCHEVWQQMCASDVSPTIVTYGCYIDACTRNKDVVSAERIFRSMFRHKIKPNAVIYTSLIRGLASAGQPVQAFALYKQMRAQGVEPTSVTFNSVIDMVARKLADLDNLQELINDMNSATTSPDASAYGILITASCNVGNLDNAMALFKQLRGQGIIFDQSAFNMILTEFARASRMLEAEEIISDMFQLGVAPTNKATSTLVEMYGRAKLPNKASEMLDLIEHGTGAKPSSHVYTCLMQAYIKSGQVKRNLQVFDRMLHQGIEPGSIAYSTVISSCIHLNKLDLAMSFVRQARVLHSRPVTLQSEVLQTLLTAMRRKEQHSLAQELAAFMKQQ